MGRMVRWNQWKYLTYTGFEDNDMLFNCEQDPEEQLNVITKYPEIAETLRSELAGLKSYDEIMVHENWVIKQLRFLMKCDFDDTTERWQCPSDLETVANPVKSKKPFEMTKWAVRLRAKIEESAND
jgi:choline-sulfatase